MSPEFKFGTRGIAFIHALADKGYQFYALDRVALNEPAFIPEPLPAGFQFCDDTDDINGHVWNAPSDWTCQCGQWTITDNDDEYRNF